MQSCWLHAAAGLVADGCVLLPLAAGCCYYRRLSSRAGRRLPRGASATKGGIAIVPIEGHGSRFPDLLLAANCFPVGIAGWSAGHRSSGGSALTRLEPTGTRLLFAREWLGPVVSGLRANAAYGPTPRLPPR